MDCLLAEDGFGGDTAAGRQELAQRMEARRAATAGPAEWQGVRRGWCLGPAGFRADLLGSLRDRELLQWKAVLPTITCLKFRATLLVFLLVAVARAGETNSPATYPSVSRGESRSVFGYDPTPDFIAFDPQYRQKHNHYVGELEALQKDLARQAANGRATPCSRQIFLEARWLTFYSAHWDQIERRLRDMREMLLRSADPPDSREQVEADGAVMLAAFIWLSWRVVKYFRRRTAL